MRVKGPLLAWTTGTPAYYGYTGNQEVVWKSIPLPSLPIRKCLIEVVGLTQRWNNENLNKGPACLTISDHIIPIKVKRWFKSLVSEAVNLPHIRQYVNANRLSKSPAATLSISRPAITGDISVDLAPLIESHVPFNQEIGWPRAGARWHPRTKIVEIKSGVNLLENKDRDVLDQIVQNIFKF
ncbi:unnamed protein product [Mytilus edulis]|uniref:Mab-21-like nucleotidyltransferase domain-containing protein n=1 Tax=Mytilus edulis TaxID=6550 RepID=A0A8S3QWN0_MYTED|nr:unnamed protein product [Mytilus edulis]